MPIRCEEPTIIQFLTPRTKMHRKHEYLYKNKTYDKMKFEQNGSMRNFSVQRSASKAIAGLISGYSK